MNDMTYSVEQIAEVCHEATSAYARAIGEPRRENNKWCEITIESRRCTVAGVQNVLDGMTPAECHAAWVEQRRRLGWSYGPVKSEHLKQSPNMVEYGKLPEHQRRKNKIFALVVVSMTGKADH